MTRFVKKWHRLAAFPLILGMMILAWTASGLTLITKTEFVCYRTYKFLTPSGDLGATEYAKNPNGTGYLIRQTKTGNTISSVDLKYNVSGLTEVLLAGDSTKGSAYYCESYGSDRNFYRDQITNSEYEQRKTQLKEYTTVASLLLPRVEAAIALDATTTTNALTNVSSASWTHTATGNNLIAVVGVGLGEATDARRIINSITYGGTTMTNVRTDDQTAAGLQSSLYYLTNPGTGAKTVTITLAAANGSVLGWAATFTGAAQSGQPDANNGNTTAAVTSNSVSVTTVADNTWIIDTMVKTLGSEPMVAGASQTKHINIEVNGAPNIRVGMSTFGPQTPAGAFSMSWSWATARSTAHSVMSIAPAVSLNITPSVILKSNVKIRENVRLK